MKIEKAKIEDTNVLIVDGIPQSVFPTTYGGYWQHMIPEDFKGKDVLLLGVGAGTIARLLLEKYPDVKITGVDNNQEVINAAMDNFKLGEIKMKIEIADGFAYIKSTNKKFDLIICDMWSGYNFPFKMLMPEFIEDCKKRLNKGGQVYINCPNLDYLAGESLKELKAFRDDIGRNLIFRFDKSKLKE